MPPDFLNSREDALVFWAFAILAFALYKDFRGVGGSFISVVRALLQYKLLLVFGSALLYSAAIVYAAIRLGIWHTNALKETIYWFLGTGVVLVGEAITGGAKNDREVLRRVLRRILAITLVIEFVVNVYALPFLLELVGVFVVLSFVAMQALVKHDTSTPAITRKFIDGVLVVVGLVYLSYFVARVAGDPGRFFARETAEDFLVAPVLTLALVPFQYAVAWLSQWEQENLRRRFKARLKSPA